MKSATSRNNLKIAGAGEDGDTRDGKQTYSSGEMETPEEEQEVLGGRRSSAGSFDW